MRRIVLFAMMAATAMMHSANIQPAKASEDVACGKEAAGCDAATRCKAASDEACGKPQHSQCLAAAAAERECCGTAAHLDASECTNAPCGVESCAGKAEAQADRGACSDTSACVIIDRSRQADFVLRINGPPETIDGTVLPATAYPQPVDFSTAQVTLHDAACTAAVGCGDEWICEELIQQAVWDAQSRQPSTAPDFPPPNDRLLVKQPAPPELPCEAEAIVSPTSHGEAAWKITVTVERTRETRQHRGSTSVVVGDGKTIILKTHAPRDDPAGTDDDSGPVYMVITPKLLK